jgi:hypothetical protein
MRAYASRTRSTANYQDGLTGAHHVAGFATDVGDAAGYGCGHRYFRLHRLDDHEWITRLDVIAGTHEQLPDRAGER